MPLVAIALGSNLGDRRAISTGRSSSSPRTSATCASRRSSRPIRSTSPSHSRRISTPRSWASPTNAAEALLDRLLALERARGRTRPSFRAPRTLDLDLILYGDLVIDTAHLTVPHPRFRERRFVLEPLADIAPELIDPVSGKTVGELLGGEGRGKYGVKGAGGRA